MDAIKLLQTRVSVSTLEAPGPSKEQCRELQLAALRAPDHARLRPWRFLMVEGEALDRLGRIFGEVAQERKPDLSPEAFAKACSRPHRAPMVIIAIARIQPHPKVPEVEQLLSVGASVQNMLNAAFAMRLGAVWRTGDIAYDPLLAQKLSLSDNEKVIGFLYLGTPVGPLKTVPLVDPSEHFEYF